MTLFGLFVLVVPPFYVDIPDINKTTEISGTLNSYYSYKWGRGKSDYFIILKLDEYSNEFEDSYLNERLCKEYLTNDKSKLKFRIDNNDTYALNRQRRIGTIGTTIDNKVLQTPEQDLNKDSAIKNYLLTILGLVLLTFAYLIYRKGQNNYVKPKLKQTRKNNNR
jgi:hypothetical protein